MKQKKILLLSTEKQIMVASRDREIRRKLDWNHFSARIEKCLKVA